MDQQPQPAVNSALSIHSSTTTPFLGKTTLNTSQYAVRLIPSLSIYLSIHLPITLSACITAYQTLAGVFVFSRGGGGKSGDRAEANNCPGLSAGHTHTVIVLCNAVERAASAKTWPRSKQTRHIHHTHQVTTTGTRQRTYNTYGMWRSAGHDETAPNSAPLSTVSLPTSPASTRHSQTPRKERNKKTSVTPSTHRITSVNK